MSKATDAYRIAKAHTPLGDKLLFREMSGREEMSRPFEYRLEVWAEEDSGVDPKALLGRTITVEVEIQGGGSRYIDGQCTRYFCSPSFPSAQYISIAFANMGKVKFQDQRFQLFFLLLFRKPCHFKNR